MKEIRYYCNFSGNLKIKDNYLFDNKMYSIISVTIHRK